MRVVEFLCRYYAGDYKPMRLGQAFESVYDVHVSGECFYEKDDRQAQDMVVEFAQSNLMPI